MDRMYCCSEKFSSTRARERAHAHVSEHIWCRACTRHASCTGQAATAGARFTTSSWGSAAYRCVSSRAAPLSAWLYPQLQSCIRSQVLNHGSTSAGANLTPPSCCIVMECCRCSLFQRLHSSRCARAGTSGTPSDALQLCTGALASADGSASMSSTMLVLQQGDIAARADAVRCSNC